MIYDFTCSIQAAWKPFDISKRVISNFEAPDGTLEVFSISQHTVYKPFNGKVMGWFGTKKIDGSFGVSTSFRV